jgi:hypothetical protein
MASLRKIWFLFSRPYWSRVFLEIEVTVMLVMGQTKRTDVYLTKEILEALVVRFCVAF